MRTLTGGLIVWKNRRPRVKDKSPIIETNVHDIAEYAGCHMVGSNVYCVGMYVLPQTHIDALGRTPPSRAVSATYEVYSDTDDLMIM